MVGELGKSSRRKRERRDGLSNQATGLVAGLASSSLIPLLEAASVSPTAAHRGPSIAVLFDALAKRRQGGDRSAGANVLPELIARVSRVQPSIGTLEDFRPYDARPEVLVRWGSNLFRLLPGSLERPVAMVNQHILLASVIDRVLVPLLGFGLLDAGELVLRRLDHVARTLVPRWPNGPASEVGDDPHISQAEVDAAAGLSSLDEMLRECVNPDRAAAAVARYTVAAKDLQCDPSHPVSTFRTAIATRIHGLTVPMPAGFLLESLLAIGAELAAVAS